MEARDSLTDESLMRLVCHREQWAFELLYERHSPIVLGLLNRIMFDRAVAEEVRQETFLRIWTRAHLFDPQKGRFTTWMFNIARRLAIDELRKLQRRPISADSESASDFLLNTPCRTNILRLVTRQSDELKLRRLVEELPQVQQEIIIRAFAHGKSHRAIANETGLPLGTVHTRVRCALKSLRFALEDDYPETIVCVR